MKRFYTLLAATVLVACGGNEAVTPPEPDPIVVPTPGFANGADISWVSEMERSGKSFKKQDGTPADIMDGEPTEQLRERLTLRYMRHYSTATDFTILMRNWNRI